VSQPGTLGHQPAPPQEPGARRPSLVLRGAAAAVVLGIHSIVGAVGAFLALLPVALHPAPRGRVAPAPSRAKAAPSDASGEPIAG